MTDDPRETGTSMIIRHVTNLTETRCKQFLILYDHPSCSEPHFKPRINSSCFSRIIRHVTNLTENIG
jgi:hypothetical protein